MAGVSAWLLATLALLPTFAIPAIAMLRGSPATRLAALQLATVTGCVLLILMTFVFDQPSFVDLALGLAFLALPGTLLMSLFFERWL